RYGEDTAERRIATGAAVQLGPVEQARDRPDAVVIRRRIVDAREDRPVIQQDVTPPPRRFAVEPGGALIADALPCGPPGELSRRIQPLLARQPSGQLRVGQRV